METGKDKFLKSSDSLLGRVAEYMDKCTDMTDTVSMNQLKDLCDIVKIAAMSIKALKEDDVVKKSESPIDKAKRRANGSQVMV